MLVTMKTRIFLLSQYLQLASNKVFLASGSKHTGLVTRPVSYFLENVCTASTTGKNLQKDATDTICLPENQGHSTKT